MTSRIIEWGTGAGVGSLVAGVVTSAIGFGLGIVGGVAAMKANRAGIRYLFGR